MAMLPDERTLLLIVARILRARIPDMSLAYRKDDIDALTEALRPFSSNLVALHPNEQPKEG